MTQGDCREADPELFHSDAPATLRAATKLCASCPVIDKCLAYALDNMDDGDEDSPNRKIGIGKYGVWGGTTPIDRWRILGRRSSFTNRRVAA